ncbi:tRNA (adenosine(37)-N6)-threonylcarbamoyltransferase complex ATPase subunit type 1 TsaE [candidate division FCPU426 bacterium]|nr:tRNA (adenosine(37)-N6)-threonylcarbamoyltransferase complex ATPase subunit type 1 TsaE [candidate division FCPU426 bacterium]
MPADKKVVETGSEEETVALGAGLAGLMKGGDVVALYGELGAGKTCWVRGLVMALSASAGVSSPTFTILNEYPGATPVYHFDFYRLRTTTELEEIGCEEYFYGDGICVLEWPDIAEPLLPKRHWKIFFEISSETTRRIVICPPENGGSACFWA